MDVYVICFLASFLFARAGHYYLSGFVLILAAVYLYWYDYKRSGNVIHLRGVFSFFWVFGQALACLKLSHLQTDWSLITWLCFFIALTAFWLTFQLLEMKSGSPEGFRTRFYGLRDYSGPVFQVMSALTAVSLAAFLLEAYILGFVPFLVRGVPHAYSTFHITGVHYLTVSCVLVPALSVLYFHLDYKTKSIGRTAAVIMDVIAFAIPVLCVSRFQLILAVMLAVFTYILCKKDFSPLYAIGAVAAILPVYLILTVARSHDVEYLNGIFEMKNSHMPIFITQPYMYIANNYDNFNCLVENLQGFAWGMKSLFPLWALTGLKFLAPWLVNYPIIVNKEELTTLTLFYDSYYDFGVIGVFVFACMLGAAAYFVAERIPKTRNPVGYLFYAQIVVYFMFSFFTTWFSNPATWFYFAVTGIIFFYCSWKN